MNDIGYVYRGTAIEQTLKQDYLTIAELDLNPGIYLICGSTKVEKTSTDYYRLWLSYTNANVTDEEFTGSFVNNISMVGEGGGQTVLIAYVYIKAKIKLHMYPFLSSGITQTNKKTTLVAVKLQKYIV